MEKKTNPSKNTELAKMIETIKDAEKNKQKTVVVFKTDKVHHNEGTNAYGFGVNDLKTEYQEAYKHLLLNYNLSTRLVNHNDLAVEWIITL